MTESLNFDGLLARFQCLLLSTDTGPENEFLVGIAGPDGCIEPRFGGSDGDMQQRDRPNADGNISLSTVGTVS